MKIAGIHHVAYRCKDAILTVECCRDMLGMDFILAIAEDHVPSTHARDPCMHMFLDAGAGNVLAFSSPRTDQRQAAFHAAWMHQKEFTGSA